MKKSVSVQFLSQKLLSEDSLEEESVTGTGGIPGDGNDAYLPGLDNPKKKYAAPYANKKVKKESTDKEPKLAAGKSKGYKTGVRDWKDAPKIPNRPTKGGFIYKELFENYNRFKKETKTRDENQQYNEAIKLVRKKLAEVNKVLEYSSRLKEEFPYQNSGMHEVKSHTKKSIEKLKTQVAEAYKKIKNLG
jgi:hypothetical protein